MAEEFNNPINIDTNVQGGADNPERAPAKDKFVIRPLRTYEEDVANFVKRGQISTSKIIAAEQKRQRETASVAEAENIKKRTHLMLKVSLGLVVLAILILWGIYFIFKSKEEPGQNQPNNFGNILIDKKQIIEIPTDYKLNSEIKTQIIRNIDVPPSDLNEREIAEILVTKKISQTIGDETIEIKQKVSFAELLDILELYPDDTFIRALDENYLLGLIKLGGETVPFILIKTLEYERVFSGMLAWERSLYREINDIFFKTLGTDDFLTLSAGNTSGAAFDPNKFNDIVIYNRDARAIVSTDNQILFFYTFVNNNHLLLAIKPELVQEIATKLNLQNIVR